jgi:hypothetical protein
MILSFSLLLGYTLGNSLGAPLFGVAGYAPIYVLSIILILAGMMSIPLFVREDNSVIRDTVVIEESTDGSTEARYLKAKANKSRTDSNLKLQVACAFQADELEGQSVGLLRP